jgi:hypothetical protein
MVRFCILHKIEVTLTFKSNLIFYWAKKIKNKGQAFNELNTRVIYLNLLVS